MVTIQSPRLCPLPNRACPNYPRIAPDVNDSLPKSATPPRMKSRMAQKLDDAMERLAALNRAGRGRVSPYRWMKRRFDAFAAMIAEKPPDWRALAEGFAEMGMTAKNGKPLSPETLRNCWWRVRRHEAAERAKRAVPIEPVAIERPVAPGATPEAKLAKKASVDDDPLAAMRREMNIRSGRKG